MVSVKMGMLLKVNVYYDAALLGVNFQKKKENSA